MVVIVMNKVSEYTSVQDFLKKLGFNENEVEVYVYLLKIKGETIAGITKGTKVPRTSVVRTLDKLLDRGLVSITTKNKEKKYLPESPKKIEGILREREIKESSKLEQTKQLKKKLPDVLELINSSIKTDPTSGEVSVKYFEGIQGFRDAHDRSLEYADSEIMFLSNHNEWRKAYTEEYDSSVFVPERVRRGIKMRSLVLKNREGKRLQETAKGVLREVRFLPDGFDFDTTLILYRNNILIMVSSKPYIAINIYSKVVYKTFKNIYENLWKQAK